MKIRNGLRLDDVLAAVVVHASQRRLVTASAGRFQDRPAIVNVRCPHPQDLTVAAITAAHNLA